MIKRYCAQFFDQTRALRTNEQTLLEKQWHSTFIPYDSIEFQQLSLFYPVTNVSKIICSIGLLIRGSYFLGRAIFNNNQHAISNIIFGLGHAFAHLTLNVINLFYSVVNLITRTLSTIFSGYTHAGHPCETTHQDFNLAVVLSKIWGNKMPTLDKDLIDTQILSGTGNCIAIMDSCTF